MSAILEKIRKLLRLARDKGASESEAELALKRAQELMLKHNIRNVEEQIDIQAVIGDRWVEVGRGDKWERMCANAVARLFTCRNLHLLEGRGGHKFVGKPENIEVCEEIFPWVCQQVEALYKLGLRTYAGQLSKTQRAEFRQTFKEACALRVNHRVNEMIAAARNQIPEHMALVVIDQSLAAANDLIKGIKIAKTKNTRKGFGSQAGYMAGAQVKLQGEVK